MMLKEGSTKVVDFRTPGAEAFMLGHGYTSQYVNMHSTLSIYSVSIAIVLRD